MKWFIDKLSAIGADRWMHFGVSVVLTAVMVIALHACGVPPLCVALASAGAVEALGLGKEFGHDLAPEVGDIVANTLGAAIVIAVYSVAIWVGESS